MRRVAFKRIIHLSAVGALFSSAWAENDLSTLHRIQIFGTANAQAVQYIDIHHQMEEGSFFEGWSERPPFIAQQLAGDSWEILSIHPMVSYGDYFEREKLVLRREAHGRFAEQLESLSGMTKFEEDMFAAGPGIETLDREFRANKYLRIESLKIAGGTASQILETVDRWNNVRAALELPVIYPFSVDAGSDVDIVFISFYPSREAVFGDHDISMKRLDDAAKQAGFDSYAEIESAIASSAYSHSSSVAEIVRRAKTKP